MECDRIEKESKASASEHDEFGDSLKLATLNRRISNLERKQSILQHQAFLNVESEAQKKINKILQSDG